MDTSEVINTILHISEKPWSDYTEADYTIEQWHAACLVHLHDGPPTSKSQCKLPVKTPNGALNRNGVHAAAAALAGARSPLKAPPEQKEKAAAALRRFYSELGETPPDSLKQSSMIDGEMFVGDILEHHGVKGMKWGVRRRTDQVRAAVARRRSSDITVIDKSKRIKTVGGRGHPATASAVRAREIGQKGKKSGLKSLTDEELQSYARRIQLEQNVSRLMFNERSRAGQFVDRFLGRKGSQLADKAAQEGATKGGKKALNFATRKSIKIARIAALG